MRTDTSRQWGYHAYPEDSLTVLGHLLRGVLLWLVSQMLEVRGLSQVQSLGMSPRLWRKIKGAKAIALLPDLVSLLLLMPSEDPWDAFSKEKQLRE